MSCARHTLACYHTQILVPFRVLDMKNPRAVHVNLNKHLYMRILQQDITVKKEQNAYLKNFPLLVNHGVCHVLDTHLHALHVLH